MQEVELKVGNIQTKLHCENRDELIILSEKLNSAVNDIKKNNTNISDAKALLVVSLQLINEIQILEKSLKDLKAVRMSHIYLKCIITTRTPEL